MEADRYTKAILSIIAILLFLNLFQNVFWGTAAAQRENSEIGRYRIAAWGAHVGPGFSRDGYYVLDTVTGKVVSSKAETRKPEY